MTDHDLPIRSLFERRYPAAVEARDAEAYLALYTPDALWIRPGVAPRRGHAAIAKGFEEMLDGQRISCRFTADEIERHGGSATVLGRSDAEITPMAGGESLRQRFDALWIVRERQGTWLIHRQIWTPTQ